MIKYALSRLTKRKLKTTVTGSAAEEVPGVYKSAETSCLGDLQG